MSYIIAIDGPAGSGKGTVASYLAEKLGFLNVDTGAMYRSITLAVLNNKIDLNDSEKIIELAKKVKIELKDINGTQVTYLNGEDVSSEIRTPRVNGSISVVSAIKEVREIMVEHQRNLAKENNIVMEGRDIGTAVFPNANIKLYLDATPEERAGRRYRQNLENGLEVPYEEVLESIKKRDRIDSSREVSPLRIPDNATIVDTNGWDAETACENIYKLVKDLMGENK